MVVISPSFIIVNFSKVTHINGSLSLVDRLLLTIRPVLPYINISHDSQNFLVNYIKSYYTNPKDSVEGDLIRYLNCNNVCITFKNYTVFTKI